MRYTVHGTSTSGNCHKVRMALDILRLPYDWREVDVMLGETRTPAFLAMNPNGKVPVLEIDANTFLAESDAILWFLAEGTPLVPSGRLARAQTLQWMFFEQYSHEPYIAVVRFWHFSGRVESHRSELPAKLEGGYHALGVMDRHLSTRRFFVGERYGIADIALYAYTHVAGEGGFELERFPSVCRWLERVRTQPGHVRITDAVGRPVTWPAG
jgi:glutathione S-transferase